MSFEIGPLQPIGRGAPSVQRVDAVTSASSLGLARRKTEPPATERLRGALEGGELGGDALERRLQAADVVLAGLDARRALAIDRHQLVDDPAGVDAGGETREREAGHR